MFMAKRLADEWNAQCPDQHYIAPLSASHWLWEAISKYVYPGQEIDRGWIESILVEYGYGKDEADEAITFCWTIARVLSIDSSGIICRDPRPFGAFGPEGVCYGPLRSL